jgi:hypothetical protein
MVCTFLIYALFWTLFAFQSGPIIDIYHALLSGRRKKYPLQKSLLKTFIRDSATTGLTKNAPLVVHEKLARKYGITTEPPEELRELLAPKGKAKVGEKTAEKEAKSKRKVRNIWRTFPILK